MSTKVVTLVSAVVLLAGAAHAQQSHAHHTAMTHAASTSDGQPGAPAAGVLAGQAAFGALSEIVRMLEADPSTDWTQVDIEGLRRHLIDMDEVTRKATVTTINVDGGARFEVRGATDLTIRAIQRMAGAHGPTLERERGYRVRVTPVTAGVDLAVLAPAGADPRAIAKVRALGFVGLLTLGDHHGPHHVSMARGNAPHGHQ